MNTVFTTPHGMIWKYYSYLEKNIERIRKESDKEVIRNDVFACHLIAIAIVETFVNAYFQVLVEEDPAHQKHKEKIYADFEKRKSLEGKLRDWPKLLFSKEIDQAHPAAKEFSDLKSKRNHLTHFKSSYSTITLPGPVFIGGTADVTIYENLTLDDAINAQKTIEDFIEYLLGLSGVPVDKLPFALQRWISKVPLHLYE